MSEKQKESISSTAHHAVAPKSATFLVVVVSTSKSKVPADDESGALLVKSLLDFGHKVKELKFIPDDVNAITHTLEEVITSQSIDAVIFSGGTGLTTNDITIETVVPRFRKELRAFSTLFSMLTYEAIGAATILSRATAGLIDNKAIFCIPGSPHACKLAVEQIISPEIGHILKHAHE